MAKHTKRLDKAELEWTAANSNVDEHDRALAETALAWAKEKKEADRKLQEKETRVKELERLLNKTAATLARATDPDTLDAQMDDETQQQILDAVAAQNWAEWLK